MINQDFKKLLKKINSCIIIIGNKKYFFTFHIIWIYFSNDFDVLTLECLILRTANALNL